MMAKVTNEWDRPARVAPLADRTTSQGIRTAKGIRTAPLAVRAVRPRTRAVTALAAAGLATVMTALIIAALALGWSAVQTIDWRVWQPADVALVTVAAVGLLAVGRFAFDVVVVLAALARGARAPHWTGRLSRTVAAGLVALIVGTGAAHAADPTPSAGWLPADDSIATTAPAASVSPSAPPPSAFRVEAAATAGPSGTMPGLTVTQTATSPSLESAHTPSPQPESPSVEAPTVESPSFEIREAHATAVATAPDVTTPDTTPPTPVPTTEHVVTAGESLWSITADLLGPEATAAAIAAAWPDVYDANRETIGSRPDLILPGQVLAIPTTTLAAAPTAVPAP